MGAVKNICDFAAPGFNSRVHPCVHIFKFSLGNHTAIHCGLIGDDDNSKSVQMEAFDCLNASGQEPEFRPAFDIVRGIVIDHPVSVKKNDFFHGILILYSILV
jgi:hypothetical protein